MLNQDLTIGILGGGQLGKMIALSSYNLGFKVVIYTPKSDDVALICTNQQIIADFTDKEKLTEFFFKSDVVTYEFENIDISALKELIAENPDFAKKLKPNLNTLEVAQNRLKEKKLL